MSALWRVMMKFPRGKPRLLSLAGMLFIVSSMVFSSSSANNSNPTLSDSIARPSAAEAEKFIAAAEKKLFDLSLKYSRADWVKSTFITDDTEALSAEANEDLIAATTELAEESKRFDGLHLPYDTARKIKLLKLSLTLPAPKDPAERDELTKIAASMEGDYGKGKYCPDGGKAKCLSLPEMETL